MEEARRISMTTVLVLVALLCSCRTTWKEDGWIGLSEERIKAKLGEPASTSTLVLRRGVRLFEYQSALYHHLPSKEEQSVDVREMQWRGLYKTTVVWFMKDRNGDWVVVETLAWILSVSF